MAVSSDIPRLEGLIPLTSPVYVGPPTLDDLCNLNPSVPLLASHNPLTTQQREEIKYMYVQEYAQGLNKLFETTWYTTHGLERLFANYALCHLFADTLDLFATSSHEYERTRHIPSHECKLVFDLMRLPRQVTYAGPADAELQTLLSRLMVVECLVTGRTQLSSPTGMVQGSDVRQTRFWKVLGDAISQHCLCESHWGLPIVPNARENAQEALMGLECLLDHIESRDVLYSTAVWRHVGPEIVRVQNQLGQGAKSFDAWSEHWWDQAATTRKFLEDVASGQGTTQVIMRMAGATVRSWRYWQN